MLFHSTMIGCKSQNNKITQKRKKTTKATPTQPNKGSSASFILGSSCILGSSSILGSSCTLGSSFIFSKVGLLPFVCGILGCISPGLGIARVTQRFIRTNTQRNLLNC